MSEAKKSLAKKLVKVMSAVGRIKKDGYNSFHKYNYVSEAAVLEEVRAALIEHNVFITQSVEYANKDGEVTTVIIVNTFIDGDTGETLSVKSAGQGKDTGDKGVYKAITGATKYFLLKNLMLPTGDDPEATDEHGKSTSSKVLKPTVEVKTEEVIKDEAPKKKVSFSKKSFTKPETSVTSSGDSEL